METMRSISIVKRLIIVLGFIGIVWLSVQIVMTHNLFNVLGEPASFTMIIVLGMGLFGGLLFGLNILESYIFFSSRQKILTSARRRLTTKD